MDWFNHLNPSVQSLIISILKVVGVFGAVLTMFAYAVLAERKISAWIQGRVGPNRTAPPLALKSRSR